MTWPALRTISQQLIGFNEDVWIFFWNNWWFREALSSGQNPFETGYLFYPTGASLVAHSNSFTSSFLALLLEPLSGPIAAYNLALLAGLWLGAMGMYLLVKDITEHTAASLLAGFVFAFAPYHLAQVLSHAHLGSIHWWPFFALFLGRALRDGRRRDALAAGLFAALTIWTGLQLGIFLLIWTVLYLLWFLWQRRNVVVSDRGFMKRTAGQIGIIGLFALLLSLPYVWQVIGEWSVLAESAGAFDESQLKQTDLLAYLVPPIYNPLWGDQFPELFERFGFNGTLRPYLGYAVLGLALVAIWGRRKQAGFWAITGGLWLLLAAGSAVRFNGVVYEQLALPYRWLASSFPLSAIRAPDRFNLLLVFSLTVLAGIGAAYIAHHRTWRWALVPLGLILMLEFLPVPIPRMHVPEGSVFLDELAASDTSYAVLDYPMGYTDSKYWLYFQTLHGKPTVEGHVSRYVESTYGFIAGQPTLSALYEGADKPQYLAADFFPAAVPQSPIQGPEMRDLLASGIRYIVLHHDSASEQELARLESVTKTLLPVYEDSSLTVYDLAQPRAAHFGRAPALISEDIRLLESTARYIEDEGVLELELLTQKTSQRQGLPDCQVTLSGTTVSEPFDPFPETAEWLPGDLAFQTLRLPATADRSTDRYDWQISCPGSAIFTGRDSLYAFDDELVLLDQEVGLQYDEGIDLDGYRWWMNKSDLHMLIRWSAREEIGHDYKYFIHLLDDEGQVVQQIDAIHCDWSCPTSQWAAGQSVADESVMPLRGLPAGEHRLAIGLYDGETGERLTVRDLGDQSNQDGYYVLDDSLIIAGEQ
jgi:hypothetical protein